MESSFRDGWREFDPSQYSRFLDQVEPQYQLELLARIACAELEFRFQPPASARADCEQDTEQDEHAEDEGEDARVQPCVQLFLHRFPELKRDKNLLIRLLVLEYALRLQYDSTPPNPESYLSLGGDAREHLCQLLELTELRVPAHAEQPNPIAVGQSDSTVKDRDVSDSLAIGPLPFNLGCFLLTRMIGKGGMGYVYSAIDLRSTARVAVKVMRRVDSWSVFRFIEEFRWLSQLQHPNLVNLYNAYAEGESRFFSMELVEGQTIRDWFNDIPLDSPLRWSRLRKVLAQLASAIQYLHVNQIIHCDVKPTNMMITTRRKAVLLDLGLAVRAGETNPFAGTFQYMAPEALAGDFEFASDWYSFGVMIFELVTSSLPPMATEKSEGKTEPDLKLKVDHLEQLLTDCPDDLAQLCRELLAADPAQRPDGAAVVSFLGGQQTTLLDMRECYGRQGELNILDEALLQVARGCRACVLIQGAAGIGKSTLVRHWLLAANQPRVFSLVLRCYHQDLTPNRVLNSLLQELVVQLRSEPAEIWRPSLQQHGEHILKGFPQLGHLLEDFDFARPLCNERVASSVSRGVITQALVSWLCDLSQRFPMLIVVDDAQWSDDESLRVLRKLLLSAEFCGMVALVDDDGASLSDQWFETIEQAQDVECIRIKLSPLTPEDCESLLGRWADESSAKISPAAVVELVRSAEGNPFLLRELSRFYFHRPRHPEAGSVLRTSTDAQLNVKRRFANLPYAAELVLQYLSVADQPLSFHQLQMTTRLAPHDLQRAITLLGSQGWIRSRADDPEAEIDISHENFRRAILVELPEERKQRRHYRIASVLSSNSPRPWARMAQHYRGALHFQQAAACALEAARAAITASAHQDALDFLREACHPEAQRSPREKRIVYWLIADCHAAIGSSQTAAQIYDQLSASGDDAQERLLLKCLAGEQWIRAGQPKTGVELFRKALARLGITIHKIDTLALFRLRLHALSLAIRKPGEPSDNTEGGPLFSDVEQCLNRAATPLTFLDNQLGPEMILRLERLSRGRGDQGERAQSLLRAAIVLSFGSKMWRRKAGRLLRIGRTLARRSGKELAVAMGHFCMFVWHIQRGSLRLAEREGMTALTLYRMCGRNCQWEQQFLQWGVLGCYWSSNELQKLKEATELLRESARQRRDPMSIFWMHVSAAHWSDLVSDDTVMARRSLETARNAISNQTLQSPRFFLWLSRLCQHLYEGDDRAAQQILVSEWRYLSRSVLLNSNHYRWLALHIRICCDLVSARNEPLKASKWMRDAGWCVRQMLKLQEDAFVTYGRAFSLVVQSLAGRIPSSERWDAVIDHLQALEHRLLANALRWHRSIWLCDDSAAGTSREQFTDQGCLRPDRLMNTIMPLPIASEPRGQ